MSLSASALQSAIQTAFNTSSNLTPESANTLMGNTLSDYIKNNAVITFSWTAALLSPPNTVDPTTTTTWAITLLSFSLSPSGETTPTLAQTAFASQIIASMSLGNYNITASGFSTSPGVFSTSPLISTLDLTTITGTTPYDAQLSFATKIIDWVTAQLPTGPCAGSHGTYVGQGLVTAIS